MSMITDGSIVEDAPRATCPICGGDPIDGIPRYESPVEHPPTAADLFDEARGDIPDGLIPGEIKYFVCDNPSCKCRFTWPQPPSQFSLEQGQVAISPADVAAIEQLQRSGLLAQGPV